MTAVSLFAVSLGTPTDGEAAGRAAGDSGSRFGDALTAAGQMLVGADGESATSPGAEGESDAVPCDGRPGASSDTSLEGDAASTALLELAAPLRPVAPDAQAVVDSDEHEGGSEQSLLAAVAGVETSTEPAPAPSVVEVQPEGEPVPANASATSPAAAAAAAPTAGAAAAPVDGGAGDAASSAPALASSTSAPDAPGAQPSPGAQSPGASAGRTAPAPTPDLAVASSGFTGAGNASGANAPLSETSARMDSGERAPSSQPAPSIAPLAPPQTAVTAATPVSTPETASANRAVAAQVSPVVVSVAQRPMGTHHLTMTVNPDSLGPVTVRAHISASGEVQVELSGATDAGRDALRGILVDLRRDLAAAMPHATLSLTQTSAADANGDRSGQGAGDTAGDRGSADRDATRGRSEQRPGAERAPDLPRIIQTTPHAGVGAGLDIFA